MSERNYGIDLLKILSMLMIVVLHVLRRGGIVFNAVPFSANFSVSWAMYSLVFCSTDIYGLISGYVGYKANQKVDKLLALYLQVFFYSVCISVLFFFIRNDLVNTNQMIESFFPVYRTQYWYFTAYFLLFIIMPVLNKVINSLSERVLMFTCLIILVLFSVIPTFTLSDPFHTNGGQSFLWLVCLYLIGGSIARNNKNHQGGVGKYVGLYFACGIVLLISKILFVAFSSLIGTDVSNMFISNTSILVVIMAAMLLIAFSRIKISKSASKKIIKVLSVGTFGVYLIHVHPVIFERILTDMFMFTINLTPIHMTGVIIGAAVVIFFSCQLIEYLRVQIFKLIGVNKLCNALGRKISVHIGSIGGSGVINNDGRPFQLW